MRAVLIDADYVTRGGRAVIRLLLKRRRFFRMYDENFSPYLYLLPRGSLEEAEKEVTLLRLSDQKGGVVRAEGIERTKKTIFGREKEVLKVFARHPSHVPLLRDALTEIGEVFEHNIPFGRRYLMDKGLTPLNEIEFEREGRSITRILGEREAAPSFRTLAFDIETYNPQGAPREDKDPVIMISYAGDHGEGVLTFRECGRPFARVFASEAELVRAFCRLIKETDAELLLGYNSTSFDLPYLRARARALGAELPLGRDGSAFLMKRRGLFTSAKIKGRVHIDVYHVVRFLGIIGALKSYLYTLGEAYSELAGKEKKAVDKMAIHTMWDDARLRGELADYSLSDARATLELARLTLPLQFELCRIAGLPLSDVVGATSGQLVEALLLRRAHAAGAIAPNKPSAEEAAAREREPIAGAFVKMPTPGIYDNIAVFDFRGLYPSIICSHNVDPATLDCECCVGDGHLSPAGHRFCAKKTGLIPAVLAEIIQKRAAIKKEMRRLAPGSEAWRALDARQQALKIYANSFYGMFRYARARWYSRACGESVTAWGRHYIQETAAKAEEAGFRVLYMDTDSLFLLLGDKTRDDALAFMKHINAALPGNMELELEGFYARGVFVTRKGVKEEKGAKKKYALLGEDGRIKIRGFEFVRRDWARVAKTTQERVLEAILREGSKEKAVAVVREVVERLREGKVPLEELVIYTQLRKRLGGYEVVSPELAAAQKARRAGIPLAEGALVGYVVTRGGGRVSDRAVVAELARDYDPAYYINNQVLPAVLKILAELGVSEDELKGEGKQQTLAGW
ncbi:MAG: DNA-directed DNA polymerase [Candidatus Micrarchaeia archaeon]